jgi:hypothetical protein
VSGPFTIRPGDIAISAPVSDALKQKAIQMNPTLSTLSCDQNLLIMSWINVMSLPPNCDGADIHSLGDVRRCGGKFVATEGGPITFRNAKCN